MNETTILETFYAPGVDAVLTALGRLCSFEVHVDPRCEWFSPRLRCEVLLQPHDARGLLTGPVARLAEVRFPLQQSPSGERWIGRLWLPQQIDAGLARKCYYRLARV